MKTRIFILLFFISTFLSATNGNFQIIGSKIMDPEGNEFIPKGVNVQGMKWVWPGNIVPQADLLINAWKFNIIRVNCKLEDGYWNNQNVSVNAAYQTIESMQTIVEAFTPHKVVVMFEFHDRTGSYYTGNDLEKLKDAYREMAALWGDNPYVWFNIMNEPGGSSANLNLWVSMHRAVIEVIRDEKGAKNVIVVDAHYWGQDIGAWNINPVPEARSSIISRGHDLISFNDKTYENIMFSFHIYDQWNQGTPAQIEFKLQDYIKRVKEKGLALMIGEFGTSASTNQSLDFPEAFKATMKIAPAHGIGLIWWHWYGGDNLKLTSSGNGNGGNINNVTDPTNLTWAGKMFWDYTTQEANSVGEEKLIKNHGILINISPNPFRESTRINFQTHVPGNVTISILDQNGSLMEVLVNGFMDPGTHTVDFQPSGSFAKGILYCKVQVNNEYEAKPMLIQ